MRGFISAATFILNASKEKHLVHASNDSVALLEAPTSAPYSIMQLQENAETVVRNFQF